MSIRIHALPLAEPTLPAAARWILDHRPGPEPEDLAGMLVIVPGSRPRASLQHALLDAAATEALLLPQIFTPECLIEHLSKLQGLDLAGVPPRKLRYLLLAPVLTQSSWLRDRPESAPGLAVELIKLFDEARLEQRDALVLEGHDDAQLFATVAPEATEAVQRDLAHLREAWDLYRKVVPRDHVDDGLAALAAAQRTWPGDLPALVAVIPPARLDRATSALMRSLDERGVPVHVLAMDAGDDRSLLLLATYRDAGDRPAHPLAPSRRLAARLAVDPPAPPLFTGEDLAARLVNLAAARTELGPGGPVRLYGCRDDEHESRVVAALVGEALSQGDAAPPEIVVATKDQELAARIVAQLRDAGIDVDDTRGRPLATLPAGRLARDLLRTVQAGWPFGPVFEVLSHPYVRLTGAGAKPDHAVRVRLLETAVRRAASARGGLEPLRDAARAADEREKVLRKMAALPWTLESFVGRLESGLKPLTSLAGRGAVAWADVVAGLRAVWASFVPDRALDRDRDPRLEIDDTVELDRVLASVEDLAAAGDLPDAPLSEITGALRQLLADPEIADVRPHRQRHLPVQVTGLVEARSASADFVVIAGMSQDVFPSRVSPPAFLSDPLRRTLDLQHRRARAGEDAELFLRLLHAAPRVVITWPRERHGEPALPSPLVQRLLMAAPAGAAAAPPPDVLRRRALPDWEALVARETAFRNEPPARIVPATPLPGHLSHAALSTHRACPYRFLLGRGLSLRRPEPVEAEYTPLDHGRLAHAVMEHFLAPGDPGATALAAGDAAAAAARLRELAAADFAGGLPERRLWREAFVQIVPEIVDVELARAERWRPAALERQFSLPLGVLAEWARRGASGEPVPAVPAALADYPIVGTIDRLDIARDDDATAAVIDFKTGSPPGAKDVAEGNELQVVLYAAAVECGAVEDLDLPAGGAWRVDHGGYYGLRSGKVGLPATPQLVLDDGGRQAAARGAAALVAEALRCLDRDEPFGLVAPDALPRGRSLPCRYCEFRAVCRLEERPLDAEVASRLTSLLTGDWRRGM